MKSVRPLANILFYLTRVAAMFYIITAVYSILAIILYKADVSGAPLQVSNGRFQIVYPFTQQPFLLGDYTTEYLVMLVFLASFYGLFLWLLSGVFNAFRKQRLFTQKNVRRLSRFYSTNLIIPVISVIAAAIFYQSAVSDMLFISFLHVIIGVFAFFMAAIFKQGLVLQEEQDLTL